jgi:mRNA interferase MazF
MVGSKNLDRAEEQRRMSDASTTGDRLLLERGRVVVIDIDVEKGLEGRPPRRTRMAVVVSDESVNEAADYPLVAVVPLSGTPSVGALYPALAAGKGGLCQTSYALVDHVRSIDKRRIRRMLGRIEKKELDAIERGLAQYLGLGSR